MEMLLNKLSSADSSSFICGMACPRTGQEEGGEPEWNFEEEDGGACMGAAARAIIEGKGRSRTRSPCQALSINLSVDRGSIRLDGPRQALKDR
ncbi:hypothetical protein SKAU_G00089260 [Synaphobranchus kaupii]|uniref:Uncharacterized protein n=1 Tax=Synaphobranchus kaupii TaxID=118154 RepID=A0A9Q1J6B8_SYNKA|nr:hypothetical protein SKAU_G00089260 [Synaphobranchus kaupii]